MNNKCLINGDIVEDCKAIANVIHYFIINISPNLAGKIRPNNCYVNPTSYRHQNVCI